MKTFIALIGFFCLACLISCTHAPSQAKAPVQPQAVQTSSTHGGTIVQFDFNDQAAWPAKAVAFSTPGTTAALKQGPFGTVDVADTAQPSGGLLLDAHTLQGNWSTGLASGKLTLKNSETNLGKLTLSFRLSASSKRPVTVLIESFNAAKKRTGGLAALIYPAAPHFYQRYALDLSDMKSFGAGHFRPTDPYVEFSFAVHAAPQTDGLPAELTYQMQLDNVNYASPAYYVSPQGSDSHDGRSEATAFATPQKAVNTAQPGDIILLMDGIYNAGLSPVADFVRPGTPANWIVLKNYPGQHPTLTSNGWNIISIAKGSREKTSTAPALAYLEIRGLHIRGEGDVAKKKFPEAMNKSDSRTNSNGIAVDGRYSAAVFHDIRIADNLVEFAPGCGIGSINADWVTVEDNICRSNCWTTIYAPSGISVMGFPNFDTTDNVYKRLVRNNVCCHNQTYEKWSAIGRYSDGNGIILDVNQAPDPNQGPVAHAASQYIGRTLVQSNLSYDNGGSGIHSYRADRVDIINNTAYMNSASPELQYAQIFAGDAHDVRIMNNILVAPVANVAAGEKPEPVNGNNKCTNVVFAHNLYFGGNTAPVMGEGDMVADPQFVHPSIDSAVADFHLQPSSPALGKGVSQDFEPLLDLDGKPRHLSTPSVGAYEK